MDEPGHVGCLLKVRLLGAIKVEQISKGKKIANLRLVGAPVQSFDFVDLQELTDLRQDLTKQFAEFLALYNKTQAHKTE